MNSYGRSHLIRTLRTSTDFLNIIIKHEYKENHRFSLNNSCNDGG